MGKTGMMTVVAMLLVTLAGCEDRGDREDIRRFGGDDEMAQARAGWPEDLSARIDSGNVAFRAGRYDDAAAVYRRATEAHPDVGAGWFGLHMAEQARGDTAAAQEALRQAEALTPGLGSGHPAMPDDSVHRAPHPQVSPGN